MLHLVKRCLLTGATMLAMTVGSSTVLACLNDSEAPQREANFQETYAVEYVEPTPEPTPSGTALVLASMAVGGVLLVGSLGVSLWKLKARP